MSGIWIFSPILPVTQPRTRFVLLIPLIFVLNQSPAPNVAIASRGVALAAADAGSAGGVEASSPEYCRAYMSSVACTGSSWSSPHTASVERPALVARAWPNAMTTAGTISSGV